MTPSRSRLASLLAALALAAAAAAPARAEDRKPASPPPAPAPAAPAKPAEAPKTDAKKAPDFKLKDLAGKERSLSEFKDKWVVLEWTNYACPYVKKHYDPGHMQRLQKTYVDKGVVWLSICSSAPGLQGNMSVEDWKKAVADRRTAATAVLLDADGTVGRAYVARKTPEIRVIDPKGTIVYAGAIDASPDQAADPSKTRNYVVEVLDAVLAGKACPIAETTPYGCSVKYAR
jgi:peroxiredoxin